MTLSTANKEINSTYYGVSLLLITILTFIILPILTDDEIIEYLSQSIYGILRIGAVFYGNTTVKKLNRNNTIWTVLLFFLPSISLIVLGQLSKIMKEMILIKLDPTLNSENINNLPSLILGTESNMLNDFLMNNAFTLKYMINNYKNYIKESTSLFPILAAYQLNRQNVKFENEILNSLNKFASDNGQESFDKLLDQLKSMTPEEICRKFI
jgi:hypothetical protein